MTRRVGLTVFAGALLIHLGIAVGSGMNRDVISDAVYFKEIAVSVAHGRGYVADSTFWPGMATMQRMPGWPALVALGLTLLPGVPPDALMRVLACLLNAGSAWLVYGLVLRIRGRRSQADGRRDKAAAGGCPADGVVPREGWDRWAVIAGMGYAVHPTAIHLAAQGLSEPLFVFIVLWATYVILPALAGKGAERAGVQHARLRLLLGSLLFGGACLVRANFVLFGPLLFGVWALHAIRRRKYAAAEWAACLACLLLFLLAPALWVLRNERVCGALPVLSTLRGQTFYGANNAVVAQLGRNWGYWVFPDAIPGEPPLRTLASEMGEYEVDAYYYAKGKQYIRNHLAHMPALWIGKLVRAYVPLPWAWGWGTVGVSGYRWLLYLLAVVGLWRARGRLETGYAPIVLAMVGTNAVTVLAFWGCARFAFDIEPFLLPLAAFAVIERGGHGEVDASAVR